MCVGVCGRMCVCICARVCGCAAANAVNLQKHKVFIYKIWNLLPDFLPDPEFMVKCQQFCFQAVAEEFVCEKEKSGGLLLFLHFYL